METASQKKILYLFSCFSEFHPEFYRIRSKNRKPIFRQRPYSVSMNLQTSLVQLSLRFFIDSNLVADTIGTLESALATARRGGTELCNLRAGLGTHGLEVWMRLRAADADVLALCRTRLQNIVGIAALIDVTHHCLIDEAAYEKATLEA
jgi:hypothetical protein